MDFQRFEADYYAIRPSYNKAIGWKTALSVLAVVALLGLWAAIVRRN